MAKSIWNSPYRPFEVGKGKQLFETLYVSDKNKIYTNNKLKNKIKCSNKVLHKLNTVVKNKQNYTNWEIDFCNSLLKYGTYTEKQKPYLIKILNKKI
jgi:hypothetical protein